MAVDPFPYAFLFVVLGGSAASGINTFRYELAPMATENDALGREEAVS
jgi:hypothetical protein